MSECAAAVPGDLLQAFGQCRRRRPKEPQAAVATLQAASLHGCGLRLRGCRLKGCAV